MSNPIKLGIVGLGRAGWGMHLKELADEYGLQNEYRSLHKLAQLGLQYEKQLKDQVVRLCLGLELGASEPVLRSIVDKAGAEDLMELMNALEMRMAQVLPIQTQLRGAIQSDEAMESGYLI